MPPLVISFFTPDYEAWAQTLIASCERHGYAADVQAVDLPGLPDWRSRVAQKGPAMLAAMRLHGCPLLWLDADSEIRERPDLFDDPPFDFAACQAPASGFLRSGTVYVRPAAWPLLQRTAELCLLFPQQGHERNLTAAWLATRQLYRSEILDSAYNTVPSMLDDDDAPDPIYILSNHESGGGYRNPAKPATEAAPR